MVKIGFKIAKGGGGKSILNEFKIANFTETLDYIPYSRSRLRNNQRTQFT